MKRKIKLLVDLPDVGLNKGEIFTITDYSLATDRYIIWTEGARIEIRGSDCKIVNKIWTGIKLKFLQFIHNNMGCCKNCKYCERNYSNFHLVCVRYPPTISYYSDSYSQGNQKQVLCSNMTNISVDENNYCGEFKRRFFKWN